MAHQQLGLAQLQKIEADVLILVWLNKLRKWKVVKWACYLDRKRKSKFLSISKNAAETLLFLYLFLWGIENHLVTSHYKKDLEKKYDNH
jgi:hypothetical protein